VGRKMTKPFDAGGWFPINNAVFDVIMPRISYAGWKVLCVAIRQTWGWVADPGSDTKQRRQSDQISYSQFKEKAGIGSYATVAKALRECLDEGYLLRKQVGVSKGIGKPIYTYSLNKGYELPTTETVAAIATETVAAIATETVVTKQREQSKQSDGVAPSSEQTKSYTLLVAFGVREREARQLSDCDLDQVQGWIEHAKTLPLDNPPGFVIRQLQAGEPAPAGKRAPGGDFSKYVDGRFGHLIQH